MATLVNGKVQYSAGEALPAIGSVGYNQSVANPQDYIAFKTANPSLQFQQSDLNAYNNATKLTPYNGVGSFQTINGVNYSVPTPASLTSAAIAPAPAMTGTNTAPATGYNGLQGAINSYTATQTPTALEQQKATVDAKAKSLYDQMFNAPTQTSLTNDAYSANGVDQAKQELQQINNSITAEQVAARHQIEQLQANNPQGQQTGALNAQIAQINRQSISKQADLAVIQLAKQNNYQGAKEIADRQVQAALEVQKNKIDALKFDYEANKDQYTKAEQRQYEQMIKSKDREYEQQKTDLKFISDLSITALQNGAPASVAASIRTSSTPAEAISKAGTYGVDAVERAYKQAQIDKLQADAKKTAAEAVATSNGGNSGDLHAYASQYVDTGKLPSPAELKQSGLSVGQVTQLAKQTPRSDGALVSKQTGVKPASLSSAQEDGISSLYDLTKKLDLAKTMFDELNTGLVAGLAKTVFYTQKQQQYDDLSKEIVDLLARARSGAALTKEEVDNYSKKLPGRFNNTFFLGGNGSIAITDLKNSITGKLDTNLNTNNLALYGYSKVNVGGTPRVVGEVLDIGGTKYRVLPDGNLTDII